ncbi:MAG TPA: TonB-dependent receptor [Steroidobacteraceae bacterium]|nr:TonB-dependent receptor [Steroidobacteraceae bacterium]
MDCLTDRLDFAFLRRAGRCAALLLTALLGSVPLHAADVGSVRGVVHDQQHRPILKAEVRLRSATSDWAESSVTDADGEFAFMTVPLGDYVLSFSAPGFTPSAQAVTVTSGYSPIAHVQLVKGNALETLTVTAAASTTVINTATPTTVVNREDIARAPGADRSNSLAMITNFVPGAYVVHDQMHVRGGHQTTWAVDGVEIPNTNIASNLGPQIDPKDVDYLEVQRGSYQADQGDRTYGVFNVVPRTGFERNNQAELIASGGSYGQTNDYLSVGSHTERFAYYASINGNRSDLGIATPVPQIIHDSQDGIGGFSTLIFNATPDDQFRFVFSARHDNYDIPNEPGQLADDVQRETDTFAIFSWVRKLGADAALTSSVFYHLNRADLDGARNDFPVSTTDQRSSSYLGGQETLRLHFGQHDLQLGSTGFSQRDAETFDVLFNDQSSVPVNAPVNQTLNPSGSLIAAYVEDTYKAADWLTFAGGIRQTHFAGALTENATSPRLGATVQLPGINWLLRGFWGKYYQAPPLTTLSGPLLQFAQNNDLGFIPLHGERDEEYQFGFTIPIQGWTIDVDHFRTAARNFFDHNNIGNSNAFLPLTIERALIQGNELAIRSPRMWDVGQFHLAYSNQTANGFGAINGGLTDFSPPEGGFALDHDQRNTANAGFDVDLPHGAFASMNFSYGSGFFNDDGPPSHLAGHAEVSLSAGKTFSESFSASLTILNFANRHLLVDNSLTFGGVHYNDPRQIYLQIHYKFGY